MKIEGEGETEGKGTERGAGMHPDECARDGDREVASNVVHFPGDWIGPRDELIPVVSAPRAEDFWSGDSAALHGVLQGPGEDTYRPQEEAVGDPAPGVPVGEGARWPDRNDPAAQPARARAGRLAFHAAALRLPPIPFPAGRTAPLIGVAFLALICLTLAIANLGGSGPGHLAQAAGPGRHPSAPGTRRPPGTFQWMHSTRPASTQRNVSALRRGPSSGAAPHRVTKSGAAEARSAAAATRPDTPAVYHAAPPSPPPTSSGPSTSAGGGSGGSGAGGGQPGGGSGNSGSGAGGSGSSSGGSGSESGPPAAGSGASGGRSASTPSRGGSGGANPLAFGPGGSLGPGHSPDS